MDDFKRLQGQLLGLEQKANEMQTRLVELDRQVQSLAGAQRQMGEAIKGTQASLSQVGRRRWAVNLFFRWIEQNLCFCRYYGTSANGLKTKGIRLHLLFSRFSANNLWQSGELLLGAASRIEAQTEICCCSTYNRAMVVGPIVFRIVRANL